MKQKKQIHDQLFHVNKTQALHMKDVSQNGKSKKIRVSPKIGDFTQMWISSVFTSVSWRKPPPGP